MSHLHLVTDPDPEPTGIGDRWQDHAACRGKPADLWFNDNIGGPDACAEAVRICNTCPVRIDCLAHAVNNGEQHGVWGGQTPKERANARRKASRLRAKAMQETGPTIPARKRCPKCERTKPSADWGRDRSSPDGLGSYCRECARLVHAINDEKRRERRRARG